MGKKRRSKAPGPSVKRRQDLPSTDAMTVDPQVPVAPPPTDNDFPDELFSSIAKNLAEHIKSILNREHDGMDAFRSEAVLSAVYWHLTAVKFTQGFVSFDQFKVNATKRSASDFINLLKEAVNGNDERLWPRVVNHGTSPDLRWPVYCKCSFLNS
jgi:hypothetical protein